MHFPVTLQRGGLSITGYGNGPDSPPLIPPQCGGKACLLLPVKGDPIFLCGLLWHHSVKDEDLRCHLLPWPLLWWDVGTHCHSLGNLRLHSNFAGIAGQWDTILIWFLLFLRWLLAVKNSYFLKVFCFARLLFILVFCLEIAGFVGAFSVSAHWHFWVIYFFSSMSRMK